MRLGCGAHIRRKFEQTAETGDPQGAIPHIFALGPFAHDDAPIVRLRHRGGGRRFRFSDAATLRIRLRDREGLPILDANAEAGSRLELMLPEQ